LLSRRNQREIDAGERHNQCEIQPVGDAESTNGSVLIHIEVNVVYADNIRRSNTGIIHLVHGREIFEAHSIDAAKPEPLIAKSRIKPELPESLVPLLEDRTHPF